MDYNVFFTKILIHIAVMTIFISIFMLTVEQYLEQNIVENQIDSIVDNFITNHFETLTSNEKVEIKKEFLNTIKEKNFTEKDNAVIKNNKDIQNKAWYLVSIMVIIIIIIIVILGFINNWSLNFLTNLVKNSLFGLFFIIIAQILFKYLVLRNFLLADPNHIKLNIIQTLAKNRCNPCDKTISNCIGPACKDK